MWETFRDVECVLAVHLLSPGCVSQVVLDLVAVLV